MLTVGFFILAILGSIALNQLFLPGTETWLGTGINSSVNSIVKTVATTVVGILFAVGAALYFLPRGK